MAAMSDPTASSSTARAWAVEDGGHVAVKLDPHVRVRMVLARSDRQ
jgi:hypothetical protein